MSSSPTLTPTPFGKPMLKHFSFAPGWKNLNHGSFGTYPKFVQARLHECQGLAEGRPDKFLRWDNPIMLDESRSAVAELLNIPVEECVFVQNATTGVNTVLRNIVWEQGDAIVFFDTIYGGCEKTIQSIRETQPQLSAFRVDYTLPCSFGTIVRNFRATVKDVRSQGLNPKLALFDTVVSMPGVRFPFEQLTVECRKEGILSLIDGAHGIGHIPLDLKKLDADFFVSNCHKWLFVPRGCAVFHVPLRNQPLLRTTYPTSHGYVPVPSKDGQGHAARNPLPPFTKSAFVSLFQFVATIDPSPYLALSSALHFRRSVTACSPSESEQTITSYIRDIVQRGADLLAARLGTWVMDDCGCDRGVDSERGSEGGRRGQWEGGLRDCALATVRLPINVKEDENENVQSMSSEESSWPLLSASSAASLALWIEMKLVAGVAAPSSSSSSSSSSGEKTATHVPIFIYKRGLWCRLSGQIYVGMEDWEWLAGVVGGLIEEGLGLETEREREREGKGREARARL